MTQIVKWLDRELKITVINMLGAVMEKVDNTQEQMDNASREMETITNNQKEILQIKSTVIEMKKAFDGLISILTTAKERSREIKDMPIKSSQIEIF